MQAGDTTVQALASQDVALRDGDHAAAGHARDDRQDADRPDPASRTRSARPRPRCCRRRASCRRTLRDAQTLFQGAALLPLKQIPPFVNAVLPLAEQLPPLTSDLSQAVPALIKSFKVLAYTTNEIAYDPGGKNPGFLYWLAWFAHNADSFISQRRTRTAPSWRTVALSSCASLKTFSCRAAAEVAARNQLRLLSRGIDGHPGTEALGGARGDRVHALVHRADDLRLDAVRRHGAVRAAGLPAHALFKETGLLVPNADVRISGVNVGKVANVQARGVNSYVTMDIAATSTRRSRSTRARSCARRRCSARRTSSSRRATGSGPKLPDGGTIPRIAGRARRSSSTRCSGRSTRRRSTTSRRC